MHDSVVVSNPEKYLSILAGHKLTASIRLDESAAMQLQIAESNSVNNMIFCGQFNNLPEFTRLSWDSILDLTQIVPPCTDLSSSCYCYQFQTWENNINGQRPIWAYGNALTFGGWGGTAGINLGGWKRKAGLSAKAE